MREFVMNYYNEFDKNAAAWLRELIKMGAIPAGDVDERSIVDVCPNDLKGYTQCHFFAGIGGWSLALQRAGIASDRPLWTGSCPCQDFSCAGKQKGFAGERDLWPAFFDLIRERRPERVFGEQVKNAVRHGWLDRLYADLEGEGYVCGSPVLGAHSAGADHIRQRIYWVADSQHAERRSERDEHAELHGRDGLGGSGDARGLADAERDGRNERRTERERLGGIAAPVGRSAVGEMEDPPCVGRGGRRDGDAAGLRRALQTAGPSSVGRLGDTTTIGPEVRDNVHGELRRERSGEGRAVGWLGEPSQPRLQGHSGDVADGDEPRRLGTLADGSASAPGFARNFWSDAIPHLCKDGKWRRFEPGVFPLVAKLPRGMVPSGRIGLPINADQTAEARVMRLKGYGNAICVDTAVMFIKTCEDILK
jgi:DNA (cytosine-5)-methyltransferase 1